MKLHYTPSHEWIHVEEDIATVGITAYAQKELGETVYIELPKLGKKIKAGEEIAILESTKAAADVYSPVSGEIIAINDALKENVNLLNLSPEKEGWLFKILVSDLKELDTCLSREGYETLIQG
jgi:glycine cleavage system H protein